MIESTLRFDDVEDVPGLLPLLWAVQRSRMRSRERSRRRPGNEASVEYQTETKAGFCVLCMSFEQNQSDYRSHIALDEMVKITHPNES